jgi:hypothetical protein
MIITRVLGEPFGAFGWPAHRYLASDIEPARATEWQLAYEKTEWLIKQPAETTDESNRSSALSIEGSSSTNNRAGKGRRVSRWSQNPFP